MAADVEMAVIFFIGMAGVCEKSLGSAGRKQIQLAFGGMQRGAVNNDSAGPFQYQANAAKGRKGVVPSPVSVTGKKMGAF